MRCDGRYWWEMRRHRKADSIGSSTRWCKHSGVEAASERQQRPSFHNPLVSGVQASSWSLAYMPFLPLALPALPMLWYATRCIKCLSCLKYLEWFLVSFLDFALLKASDSDKCFPFLLTMIIACTWKSANPFMSQSAFILGNTWLLGYNCIASLSSTVLH